jgi:hypothetical protein
MASLHFREQVPRLRAADHKLRAAAGKLLKWENREMNEALAGIIKSLEHQKSALDKAIAALREIDDDMESLRVASSVSDVPDWVTGKPATASPKPARKKRSKKVREAMRQAQLLRYAKQRGEA